MTTQPLDTNNRSVPVLAAGATQKVSYTGTPGTITNPVHADTRVVRVWASTDCHVAIGESPTATANDMPMTGQVAEDFKVKGGVSKVSFIQQTAGGTGYVTEMG